MKVEGLEREEDLTVEGCSIGSKHGRQTTKFFSVNLPKGENFKTGTEGKQPSLKRQGILVVSNQ